MKINLPNKITLLRLVLAFALFAVYIALDQVPELRKPFWLVMTAALFAFSAATDFLDGYLARRLKLITGFGRVADPFVDKVLICGSFILLVPLSKLMPAWYALLIVVRELGVTALRSHLEGGGRAFGAKSWGKAKMLAQCITVPAVLVYEAFKTDVGPAGYYAVLALLGVTLVLTLVSGLLYFKESRLDM